MADATDSKSAFKHRWRAKMSRKDEEASREAKPKTQSSSKVLDEDINAFLKPSTERAQANKEAAATAFITSASSKPKIDTSAAQRWPGANDILGSGAGKTPGIGGLKTGNGRKKGLTVSFVRTQPDVIGEGGDECEDPSIEVYRRRKSNSMSDVGRLSTPSHQDDIALGTRSPTFNIGADSANREAQKRGIVTRTLTSGGELSPPLRQKLEMGSINTHAAPPAPAPQGLGQMGLGDRPKPLSRAPTGFDMHEGGQAASQARPSMDSVRSYDSENASPVVARKMPDLPPMEEEEPDFVPTGLQRSLTGWSEAEADSDNESPPPMPAVQSEPAEPDSFAARVIHTMRAEEGKALQEGTQRTNRDSGSSSSSFQVGTPPSAVNTLAAGRTPPRVHSREPPQSYASPQSDYNSPQRGLDAEDPYHSRARGPSPGRSPMPPGTAPLDTDPRPPSSTSSYSMPSATSRNRASTGGGPSDPFSAATSASAQQTPASYDKQPFSAISQHSAQPIPPQYEHDVPPAPPAHAQNPSSSTASPATQTSARPRQYTASSTPLARSDTKIQADMAYNDFGDRVEHMQGVFELMAQLNGQIYDHPPMEWLRVAIWWFLKGRSGMEAQIRSRPKSAEPQPERLTQPHVDLAKAWFVLNIVIRDHPILARYADQTTVMQAREAREAGDVSIAETYEARDTILSSMKMLLGSMKRHQSMPPTQALIQGQHQELWEKYPRFAPDAASVLSGPASKSVLASGQQQVNAALYMPISDTKSDFCYFRMFVTALLSTEDPSTDREPLPAVISVLRSREDFAVKLSICSQTELINLTVGADPQAGPTWRDVRWRSKGQGFTLQLRHGFVLNIEMIEADFRSLWNIVDHTNKIEAHLREQNNERLSSKMAVREAAYKDPMNPSAFPPDRVRPCKLFVFEKFDVSSEGTGKRKLHRGYRVTLVTHPRNRTVSFANHELGTTSEPMNFSYVTEPDQAPALTLRFREEMPENKLKICNMHLVFNDGKERNHIFGLLTSMNIGMGEMVFAQVPLKNFSIESSDAQEGFLQGGKEVLRTLQWVEAKTYNQDPEEAGLESAPTVMSESLRILCRHSAGVFSDRMNLGPGELLVRLPNDGAAELALLRDPQQDMAIAIDSSRSDKNIPDALATMLRTLTSATTIRRLTFNSFKDLHAFQFAVTGFNVIFDGIASTFSISRRRMVVPIYKQWTANQIRIQIVQQDNVIQLLAFFENFSHADAMNFQLKITDTFEKSDKGGKPSVKLVDCKFALPVEERRGEGKMGKEEGKLTGWAGVKRRFVCLDQIEYPGEHDDVLIGFDNSETRDRFAEALPSAITQRKFTILRKI
ncbi:hypothetical protein P280DRAFT_392036 [Massarina eburnea CBS 473.64]|uniref:Uncharacterized protein n=1 Tax=Massarina eburnea CBS 473.64 TaxID=1395130 RepID=A0A6A6S985_9PLEO|nr:hypothetical protein P280DRAFT_392036 [Massarina eburnea CBS 473.64]